MRLPGYFNPTELALFAYLTLTGVLVVLYHPFVDHPISLIGLRVLVFLLIALLARLTNKNRVQQTVRLIRYMLPLVLLAYLYSETDNLNNFLFRNDIDPFLSRVEAVIFGFQPSVRFALRFPSDAFAEAMYFGYFSYYIMLAAVPLYIFLKIGTGEANRVMFMVIHSFFIFYLFFILIPSGGPQFYFAGLSALPGGYLFGDVMRFIQEWGEAPTAAFPSSHVSLCLILVVLSMKYARPMLKYLLPVAVLLILSTVYIRAHYVIDVVAAFVVTPLIYKLSEFVFNRISNITNSRT